jgi:hypothetical protein
MRRILHDRLDATLLRKATRHESPIKEHSWNERKTRTTRREELYSVVWATPMSRLATQYGLSGNGLAKICRRLSVPFPPRAYWARKAAGKKVAQTALPAIRPELPSQVTIAPSLPTSPSPQMPTELEHALIDARRVTAALKVPGRLAHPHRIVAAWIEERQRSREQAKRCHRSGYLPPDFPAIERRRHRLLSVLFNILEKHGYAPISTMILPAGVPLSIAA